MVAAGDAPTFIVTDDPDLGLAKRLLQEASLHLLIASILLATSYWVLFEP